ncbi:MULTISPECIES: acyl carrier protein [Xanthocytophaga]|uniref:Phosphopantetheine-binding protein n=2 Tax=Xanthocytophaga TaxID=3078918 RepID=A0AAE3QU02_9BACT|nr:MULTISPECIES: phosphopantetheine-binding protein [Xanthocytophaga]MDJ1485430.1 phosphopantetheine-binding protein [Xanthocytophaga flavus]MDJ1503081.1 phosphopantetheine-binding protein [Xanthocytophaga agilis]
MIQVIKDRVEYNLQHHFLIRQTRVNPEYNFNKLGLSPMEKLELLLYIEREFGIEFSEEEIHSIGTVSDLIKHTDWHYSQQHHFHEWSN